MAQKYRHKKLGWIAEFQGYGPCTYKLVRNPTDGYILPAMIVEDSNDWEEIKEVEWIKTEDGVTVSGPHNTIWRVDLEGNVELYDVKRAFYDQSTRHKYFYDQQAANKLARNFRPLIVVTADCVSISDPTAWLYLAAKSEGYLKKEWAWKPINIYAKDWVKYAKQYNGEALTVKVYARQELRDAWIKEMNPKPVLLTSEEGEKITDPKQLIFTLEICGNWDKSISTAESFNGHFYPGRKYFSTEKARDEYKMLHKPVIHIREVQNLLHYIVKEGRFSSKNALMIDKAFKDLINAGKQRI